MLVFIDFEASSLGKESYPIEVAWVFEDGRGEEYLIRPAPWWTEWNDAAEAIHHISRDTLIRIGVPHDVVAKRMVDALSEHDLLASAPSWDGKWLSNLLRSADFPRHILRLRDTDDAIAECATAILNQKIASARLQETVTELLAQAREIEPAPAHRALADAMVERDRWVNVVAAAQALNGVDEA